MRILTADQYKISADIAGNIATVWFAGGVVSPLFLESGNIARSISSILAGLIMTAAFVAAALVIASKIKE